MALFSMTYLTTMLLDVVTVVRATQIPACVLDGSKNLCDDPLDHVYLSWPFGPGGGTAKRGRGFDSPPSRWKLGLLEGLDDGLGLRALDGARELVVLTLSDPGPLAAEVPAEGVLVDTGGLREGGCGKGLGVLRLSRNSSYPFLASISSPS